MKKILYVITVAVCILSFAIICFAHPGKTDSDGGHYDHSTGEYHYHHGYSAHQHPNGVCPYENEPTTKIDWDYYKDKAQKLDEEEYQKIIDGNKDGENTTYKSFAEYAAERFKNNDEESINTSNSNSYNNYGFATIDEKDSQKNINSFVYTFRTITWSLVISFFITIALMFVIYGLYEYTKKQYMSDKLAVIVSTIIFLIIAVGFFKGFIENQVIDYYKSFSFSFSNFGDVIFVLIYLVFAFFGSGFIIAILSEITPLFDEKKYKSKKVYNLVLIIVFIMLFIVLFDIAQYFELFN